MANKKLLKNYHGIPKTVVDVNHVFYASLDGITTAEVGGAPTIVGSMLFKNSLTGLGIVSTSGKATYSIPYSSVITLDYMINDNYSPITLCNNASIPIFFLDIVGGYFRNYKMTDSNWSSISLNGKTKGKHARIIMNFSTNSITVYIDGIKIINNVTMTYSVVGDLSQLKLIVGDMTGLMSFPPILGCTISDVSISNIDRGDFFPNLPQDFIEGNARISPAFNEQRSIYSDALTSEYKLETVKAIAANNTRQYALTQATAGIWVSGDKIALKGLAGEIISGVVDTDTALATITSIINTTTVGVDDVSKLIVGDTLSIYDKVNTPTPGFIISAIDTINKTVTVTSWTTAPNFVGCLLIETTPSTSSPIVKIISTGTPVVGTWASLGTNQATFTLGTNATLTNQDMSVEYSLNEISGQAGIPEVLVTTLGGEYGGNKLTLNTVIPITDDLKGTNPNVIEYSVGDGKVHYEIEGATADIYASGIMGIDFTGKVSGSIVENCNVSKSSDTSNSPSSVLLTPSSFSSEVSQLGYGYINVLDTTNVLIRNSTTNGIIPQQLVSFDVIKNFEKKYGVIPSATQSVADKIIWLKGNMPAINFKWYGYGSCPSGNKATISRYDFTGSTWGTHTGWSNTSSTPTSTIIGTMNISGTELSSLIDANGFIHFLAYTDAASATSPTLLVMSGHGLLQDDVIENATRGVMSYVLPGGGTDRIIVSSIAGQTIGDVINKYHANTTKICESGTIDGSPSTVKSTNHGLTTGDVVVNWSRTGLRSKITVLDVNTFTTPISFITGDSFKSYKFYGTQTAESGVIPSTIYTDYVSLDITLKPSYKSLGEDVGGTGVNQINVLSRGKNLFNNLASSFVNTSTRITDDGTTLSYKATNGIDSKLIKVKPNTNYYIKNTKTITMQVTGVLDNAIISQDMNYASINSQMLVPNNTVGISFNSGAWTSISIRLYYATDVSNFNIQLEEGSSATAYTPYVEDKKNLTVVNPLRRVSTTVADKYSEGQVTRNISNWVSLDGISDWVNTQYVGYKRFSSNGTPTGFVDGILLALKYNGIPLTYQSATGMLTSDLCTLRVGSGGIFISASNSDTGFCDSYSPLNTEISVYFKGYKMCHSDGVSPYQVSEAPYTPSNWAEWSKSSGVVGDSSGLEFTGDATSFKNGTINATIKAATKYGFLYNVVSKSIIGTVGSNGVISNSIPTNIGNNKYSSTTVVSSSVFQFFVFNNEPVGNKIKFKDIRLFELPPGSQIETDFNTLTPDQLSAKYLFYGLNPKNWKSVVDGSGQTATLPTTQAPNYTPYKMLYQLATPTTEAVTTTAINGYNNGTIALDGGPVVAKDVNLLTSLIPATDVSWISADKSKTEILDGTYLSVTSTALGSIPQIKVKFDIIKIIEQKLGTLPCASDLASKIAWLTANITSTCINCYTYGSCPNGSKAYLNKWAPWNTTYGITGGSNTSSTPTILSFTRIMSGGDFMDPATGLAHVTINTDPASQLVNSTINLDYISLDITLKTPTGFDAVVPSNPRRDSKGNVLLIRKETKEIRVMFGTANNDSGVVTFGDYYPKQGMIPPSSLVGGYIKTKPEVYVTTLTTQSQKLFQDNATYFDLINEFTISNPTITNILTDGNPISNDSTAGVATTLRSTIVGQSAYGRRGFLGKISAIGLKLLTTNITCNFNAYIDTSMFNQMAKTLPLVSMIASDLNGNLYLLLATTSSKTSSLKSFNLLLDTTGNCALIAFKLPNNPLIK